MARPDPRHSPKLPLFDRLALGESEAEQDRERVLARLRESVRRDLETLLNTRPRCVSSPPGLDELAQSIVAYGMPDTQSRALASGGDRDTLRRDIEAIIRRFEPRFAELQVSLLDPADEFDRVLRLRIEAVLIAEAEAEPVVFDAALDPTSRNLVVRASAGER